MSPFRLVQVVLWAIPVILILAIPILYFPPLTLTHPVNNVPELGRWIRMTRAKRHFIADKMPMNWQQSVRAAVMLLDREMTSTFGKREYNRVVSTTSSLKGRQYSIWVIPILPAPLTAYRNNGECIQNPYGYQKTAWFRSWPDTTLYLCIDKLTFTNDADRTKVVLYHLAKTWLPHMANNEPGMTTHPYKIQTRFSSNERRVLLQAFRF